MLNKSLNKNELLGIANILFGMGYLFSQLLTIVKYVPAQQEVFNNFGTEAPSPAFFYFVAAIFMLIGFADLYIGVRLWQDNKSEKLFNRGLILFIGSILGLGIYSVISTLLVILPIYNLTESL